MVCVLRKLGFRLETLGAVALGLSVLGATAFAQSAPGTVSNIIAANLAAPGGICPAIKPVIAANPGAFSELVSASQSYPDLIEPFGECCAAIQKSLKNSDPGAAGEVSAILASSPPAFQAACAVSLADQGQSFAATSGGDGGSGTSGVGYGGGTGGGGTIGGGGGTISPSSP